MLDVSPRWSDPRTVAGFVSIPPNAQLLEFASARLAAHQGQTPRCLDLGCGAARNALPLAELGYHVSGVDLSAPMLVAAQQVVAAATVPTGVDLVRAPMAPLPFPDATFDLIVAHGIWNLARSAVELRHAVGDTGRVARRGAGLFLFTFSRYTLPPDARPDAGELFVYSCWNGEPQTFLTEEQIDEELGRARFVRDAPGPLTEYNRPRPGELRTGGPPVIYEGTFVKI